MQAYVAKPKVVHAFQWVSGMAFPSWFTQMIEKGQAFIVNNRARRDCFIRLENKRGVYKGRPGDWICKDEYGHIFVVSQRTFEERYERVAAQ